jgi:hypothetical protein
MNENQRQRGGLTRAEDILPAIIPDGGFDEIIKPEDLHYTHPVFLQCFLPTRHTTKNRDRWQTNCGRASLVIRAGELANPDKPNEYEPCIVPAGPKARFVVGFVNDYIQRNNTQVVDLGQSLRKAMTEMKIPIGGKNGHELTREVKNFASAEVRVTTWNDNVVHDHIARVAPQMSFWLEKDPDQQTIWRPEMTVSPEYFEAVRDGDRMAPVYWPAMVALQHDTRAMDIHSFLTYRLRNSLKHPVTLNAKVLHAMFGQDVKLLKHFWSRFQESLSAALQWYPGANVEVKNDCIVLRDSPPLIPHRKMPRIGTGKPERV